MSRPEIIFVPYQAPLCCGYIKLFAMNRNGGKANIRKYVFLFHMRLDNTKTALFSPYYRSFVHSYGTGIISRSSLSLSINLNGGDMAEVNVSYLITLP
jgi:hypothetical protein